MTLQRLNQAAVDISNLWLKRRPYRWGQVHFAFRSDGELVIDDSSAATQRIPLVRVSPSFHNGKALYDVIVRDRADENSWLRYNRATAAEAEEMAAKVGVMLPAGKLNEIFS